MGSELDCRVLSGDRDEVARVLLETSEIIVRGPFRLKIAFSAMTRIEAEGAELVIDHGGATTRFVFAASARGEVIAQQWAHRIRAPKGRMDKLGARAGQRWLVVDVTTADDATFVEELRATGVTLHETKPAPPAPLDAIVLHARSVASLAGIAPLLPHLDRDGALWLLRRKGKDAPIAEAASRQAARQAGLVDVKVVGVSETLSGEKYVRPKAGRQ